MGTEDDFGPDSNAELTEVIRAGIAESLAPLRERIEKLKAAHEADRRERVRPEVSRYLRMSRDRGRG